MKRINLIVGMICVIYMAAAQVPDRFKYQAVLRDAQGNPLAEQTATLVVDILQGNINGSVVFTEAHHLTTTALGLININIGSVNTTGLAAIDWSVGLYFIRITVNGVEMGTSQIMSVPYALYAKYAQTADYENLMNRPELFSGSYDDLINKPAFPEKISDLSLDASGQVITNVASPASATDAVNKAYVDLLMEKILSLQVAVGVEDPDGYSYKVVRIGSQVWMAENLRTTKYNDGTPIPLVTDNTTWGSLSTPAYCWYNNDEPTYKSSYGALYNWYAINTGKLCPSHWHVPSRQELLDLETYLGGNLVAGGKLKEGDLVHWQAPNAGATNSSQFTARGGGVRSGDSAPGFAGVFSSIQLSGVFLSSTLNGSNMVYFLAVNNTSDQSFVLENLFRAHGGSIRCIHD